MNWRAARRIMKRNDPRMLVLKARLFAAERRCAGRAPIADTDREIAGRATPLRVFFRGEATRRWRRPRAPAPAFRTGNAARARGPGRARPPGRAPALLERDRRDRAPSGAARSPPTTTTRPGHSAQAKAQSIARAIGIWWAPPALERRAVPNRSPS